MANPLSSVKDFFGWSSNPTEQYERPQPASSTGAGLTSKISSIGTRRPAQSYAGAIFSLNATEYANAKEIAEAYRNGASVIVNMADMSELDQRRMVDFMSGLKEALNGGLQRIGTKAFLLVAPNVPTNQEEEDDEDFGPADGLVINPMR